MCKQQGVNGCYVWCRRADGALEGRNLNHLDPAAGDNVMAAGARHRPLGCRPALYQCAHLGTPCRLHTTLRDEIILIGGKTEPA